MSLAHETVMSPEEIDAFLGERETGVLSLANGAEPYAIPISYGYNASARRFFMRLVSTPESEKRRFLSSSPEARLVVYDETADGTTYRSVVAKGPLEGIEPDSLSIEDVEQYGKARRPLFEIWGSGRDELDIRLYRLDPEELSGHRTEIDRENAD